MGRKKLKQSILKDYIVVIKQNYVSIFDNSNKVRFYEIYYTRYIKKLNILKLLNFLSSDSLFFDFNKIVITFEDYGFDENKMDKYFQFNKIQEKLIYLKINKIFSLLKIIIHYRKIKSIEKYIKRKNIYTELFILNRKFSSLSKIYYANFLKKLSSYIDLDINNFYILKMENFKIQLEKN